MAGVATATCLADTLAAVAAAAGRAAVSSVRASAAACLAAGIAVAAGNAAAVTASRGGQVLAREFRFCHPDLSCVLLFLPPRVGCALVALREYVQRIDTGKKPKHQSTRCLHMFQRPVWPRQRENSWYCARKHTAA